MGVKVKNYAWHRDWHQKMMSDPGYQHLGLEERGAYQTLRNLAGITNNSGSLRGGTGVALDLLGVARWLAQFVPGVTIQRARSILAKLLAAGLVAERSGRVVIVDWADDQRCAWSAEAERQKRSRENRKQQRDFRGGGDAEQGGGVGGFVPAPEAPAGGAALPPPPPSTPTTTAAGEVNPPTPTQHDDTSVTCHAKPRDTSHRKDEDEERRKEPYGSRTSTSTGGGGGKAAGSQQPGRLEVPALERLPPEEWAGVCCAECGVFDAFNRNTFADKLRQMRERVGDDLAALLFAASIAELRDAIRAGKCRKRQALLTSILRDHAEGRPHNP